MFLLERTAVPVRAHIDTDYCMTSPNDIILPPFSISREDPLPRGIKIVRLNGNEIVFVKWSFGRLLPLPQAEQIALAKKCGLINGD